MHAGLSHVTDIGSRSAVRAGGSSFYLAMRILGRHQRQAMFEVYSFCRAVDDVADSSEPRASRLSQLAQWRDAIDALYAGTRVAGLEQLSQAIDRFSLRRQDFMAVIDGMEMDAEADMRAPDFVTLEKYCDRVACAVGRLSVRIFGLDEGAGLSLAHHLGQALQLTNILRDIDEDAAAGRLYLPSEALHKAGIEGTDPKAVTAHPRIDVACRFVAERARTHFITSDAIMAAAPRHVIRAPKIMEEVYRKLLDDMVAQGWTRPRVRVHVNKPRLIWIALRHGFV
ncbi:MAG TPA: presqualene diphosphate synthase HpnD [Pseudolabrys sp.]|nr:presqualene diphosphate synthase HpnD [Pseudolabrys sp.]